MTNNRKGRKQVNAARHIAALPAFGMPIFCMLLFCMLIFTGCAASGTTGTDAAADSAGTAGEGTAGAETAADGEYTVEVSLEGGSGKASISSPADLTVQDGEYTASIEWSSPYYDYMILDGETYYPVNADGNSVFEIPVTIFDEPIAVTADTTAMSTPHEIEYTLTFYADTITPKDEGDESDAGDGDAAGSESDAGNDDAAGSGSDAGDGEFADGSASDGTKERDTNISEALTFTGSMEITYAEEFTVDYYTCTAGSAGTAANVNTAAGGSTTADNSAGAAANIHTAAGSTGTAVSVKTAAGCVAENVNTAAAADSGTDTAVNVNTAAASGDSTAARWALITISGEERFLVVPEGYGEADVPADLDEDIVVFLQPAENIYLAASAVMDMFIALDALDAIRFSGTDADGWYLEEAVSAMESGDILYAGKYSAPDYEQLLAEGCTLAIENTMIYHTPEVQEQLERLGISVLVDHSSYETEPLGRIEWVKLYGVLLGKEDEAFDAFAEQEAAFAQIADAGDTADTGLTAAFFYITSSGEVNVRKSADYIAQLINMAGGTYIFTDLGDEEDASSTVTLTMEEFYAAARDADYLIYNSTIDGELSSVEELLGKSALLENFKAVKEGNVYCTAENFYQSSMELGDFLLDIAGMLAGEDDLVFLHKLN